MFIECKNGGTVISENVSSYENHITLCRFLVVFFLV